MELIFVFLVAIIAWFIIIYNLFMRDKNRVLAAWSDIDVQLKRRHDLIPKLIDAVKQYAAYESSTLSAITTLRSQSEDTTGIEKKGKIEGELSAKLHPLPCRAINSSNVFNSSARTIMYKSWRV